jgi:uncharacterized protein YcbX
MKMQAPKQMHISEINVYPIKSLRGNSVNEARVCGYGLEHDRRWMLVDAGSRMITQRECPRLATLAPRLENGHLRVQVRDGNVIDVSLNGSAWSDQQATVDVFGHQYVGVAASDAINRAFSDAIQTTCCLLSIRSDVFRVTTAVAFHDSSPILAISQASLDELNKRLPTPLPMNRFRPNLVITGANPFEEDSWQRIAIGETDFRLIKQCERCAITTVDQAEGAFSGPEPLKTLAAFRRKGPNVAFGAYYRPEGAGAKIRVGEEVCVLAASAYGSGA